MKTKGETHIPEDFKLTDATIAWVRRKYPQVDIEATLERFIRAAEAQGWIYRNWQRAFEGVIDKGMLNGWRSIVTLVGGREVDPNWQRILHEARKHGFREPNPMETPAGYKTQFDNWNRDPKRAPVFSLEALKRARA